MEFTQLTELAKFAAVNNMIAGKFPVGFADMTKLEWLVLVGNKMTGSLPEGFLVNSPLIRLFLSNNAFTGPLPVSLGAISTLTQISLNNNKFTGGIPNELSTLANLANLDLSNNNFQFAIPEGIYQIATLEKLYLDGNVNLIGTVSSNIGNLSGLNVLRLGGTRVGGVLPTELYGLFNLAELDLTGARFSGAISEDFALLAGSLRILSLANNSFVGSVPAALDALTLISTYLLVD
jgi:Leucine-rich repeat (LRR) protein